MSLNSKIFILIVIVSTTFFYSHFSKKRFDEMKGSKELVLKNLPDLTLKTFVKGEESFTEKKLFNLFQDGTKGMFVHYWGTWCAPCEVEFPEFLKFADSLKSESVKFLIVAVNDDIKKVNKFLKRFKEIPPNVVFGFDADSSSMSYFGTVKVPETYLFNSNGKHLSKFIGPQDWENPSFAKRTMQLLNKIETGPIKQISTN